MVGGSEGSPREHGDADYERADDGTEHGRDRGVDDPHGDRSGGFQDVLDGVQGV